MNPQDNSPQNFNPHLGRGMPVGGVRPPGQQNGPLASVMLQVNQLFHNQGPFNDWKAEVLVRERCAKVFQLCVS